jgi:hypothetical protein
MRPSPTRRQAEYLDLPLPQEVLRSMEAKEPLGAAAGGGAVEPLGFTMVKGYLVIFMYSKLFTMKRLLSNLLH